MGGGVERRSLSHEAGRTAEAEECGNELKEKKMFLEEEKKRRTCLQNKR